MSICGIYHPLHKSLANFNLMIEKLLLHPSYQKSCIYSQNISLASTNRIIAQENHTLFETDRKIIAADVRLSNRNELLNIIAADNTINDTHIILKLWELLGADCLQKIAGDFAFIIFDKKTNELFCARDQFGIKPFFYTFSENEFIFASTINSILSSKTSKAKLNKEWIVKHISRIREANNKTCYQDVFRLMPAHAIRITKDEFKIFRYWFPPTEELELTISEDEIIQTLRHKLNAALDSCLDEKSRIGAELSGGIDSALLTGIAAKVFNKQLTCFTHALQNKNEFPFNDEIEFVNRHTQFLKSPQSTPVYASNRGVLNALQKEMLDHNTLFPIKFQTLSHALYAEAEKKNIDVLISGYGGDEFVSSATNCIYSEFALKRKWRSLFKILNDRKVGFLKNFKDFCFLYFKERFSPLSQMSILLKGRVMATLALMKMSTNTRLIRLFNIKEKYALLHHNYTFLSCNEESQNRISNNIFCHRFESCYQTVLGYGIEYRYPLFNKDLIEYWMQIPSHFKMKDGIKRNLIRQAAIGSMPETIRNRNDKAGITIPSLYRLFLNDFDDILSFISASEDNEYVNKKRLIKWTYRIKHKIEKGNQFYQVYLNTLELLILLESRRGLNS